MLKKLIEIYNHKSFSASSSGNREAFSVREVYINPEHVVCMRENPSLKRKLAESDFGDQFNTQQDVTKIYINRGQSGLDLDVVGDMSTVKAKLFGNRSLLNE